MKLLGCRESRFFHDRGVHIEEKQTIGHYLIQQLGEYGIDHIFGVPGDYVLSFYRDLEQSRLHLINTGDEQGAGFAADAYARLRGLGVVCVTYGVGGLKLANTTAQALAEKSPVVIVSGAPNTYDCAHDLLLHHRAGDFDTQRRIFGELTVASTRLDDPQTAADEVDRVLTAAFSQKGPVYIELPRDMVTAPCAPTRSKSPAWVMMGRDSFMSIAIDQAVHAINRAARPVIIAGVEIQRFGLQQSLLRLIEQTNIPVAATLLGKSVLSEHHPRYMGIYQGAMSQKDIQAYVEDSDCLILLGALMSDINLGIYTAKLNSTSIITVSAGKTVIGSQACENICLLEFLPRLLEAGLKRHPVGVIPRPEKPPSFEPTNRPVTVRRLFQRLQHFIDPDTVVLADTGDAMFAAASLAVYSQSQFLSSAYYTSLGFAIPASLGVQLARPDWRPLALVGDGSFQMGGLELATAARFGLTPIIVILNNQGYGTERPMIDGSFNDIPFIRHSVLPDLIGAGRGFDIRTETQLDAALHTAREDDQSLCVLDVHLDRYDISPALQRLTSTLKSKVA